jgi:hypothetical protein
MSLEKTLEAVGGWIFLGSLAVASVFFLKSFSVSERGLTVSEPDPRIGDSISERRAGNMAEIPMQNVEKIYKGSREYSDLNFWYGAIILAVGAPLGLYLATERERYE